MTVHINSLLCYINFKCKTGLHSLTPKQKIHILMFKIYMNEDYRQENRADNDGLKSNNNKKK